MIERNGGRGRWWGRSLSLGVCLSALVVLGVGCAAGGSGSNRGLSWDLGIATPRDAMDKSVQVLRNYQYDVERDSGPPNIYIITRWRERTPFDDEQAAGIEAVQTRFIVEARPRTRNPEGQDMYTVRIRAENMVRMSRESGDWSTEGPVSSEFRAYAGRIADDIRSSLATGIRMVGP